MAADLQQQLQGAKQTYENDLQAEKDSNAQLIAQMMEQHKELIDNQDAHYKRQIDSIQKLNREHIDKMEASHAQTLSDL
jgi:hypothetical protein